MSAKMPNENTNHVGSYRWNQFSFPFRYIQSEEMARYEDCLKCKKAPEDEQKAVARHLICCNVQNEMREPTFIPDDHHINPGEW